MKKEVPLGWSKGEPLVVTRLGETDYQLTRSGGYLDVPGCPVDPDRVLTLHFSSRVEMVEWMAWWDNPDGQDLGVPNLIELTPCEYLEVIQELYSLDLQAILGKRRDNFYVVPSLHMVLKCPDAQVAKRLNELHVEYASAVEFLLEDNGMIPKGDDE